MKHPRLGFAARTVGGPGAAAGLWVVRAVLDAVQPQALFGELSLHFGVKSFYIIWTKQPARNARLVAGDQRLYTMRVEQAQQLPRTWCPDNVRRLDREMTVSNEYAVSIENDS